MKDKLMALVIIAVILEVVLIIVISILAIVGAMNLTDGCMTRYPLTGSNASADAFQQSVTVNANGSYPSQKVYAGGYTYGQWMKTNINVEANQLLNFNVSGTASLCRAYLPAHNLESPSNLAAYTLGAGSNIIAGQPIPIPRLEEPTTPAVQLLFDSSASGGWLNVVKVGYNDRVQVTIGVNPIETIQNDVSVSSLGAMPFSSIFSGHVSSNCSDGHTAYSGICNRYTIYNIPATPATTPPTNQPYITGCNVSILQMTPYWTCGGGVGNYEYRQCSKAHPANDCNCVNWGLLGTSCATCCGLLPGAGGTSQEDCCIWNGGSCDDSCAQVDCSQSPSTATLWTSVTAQMPHPYVSAGTYTYPAGTQPFGYGANGFRADSSPTTITDSHGVAHTNSTVCAAQNTGVSSTTNYPTTTAGTWPDVAYKNQQYFWFTSDAEIGLYQRNDPGINAADSPTSAASLGAIAYMPVSILTRGEVIPNIIADITSNSEASYYLQYRFRTIGEVGQSASTFNYNSGGYTVGIKQTACRVNHGGKITSNAAAGATAPATTNPQSFNSSQIGDVRYAILPSGSDPNDPVDPGYANAIGASTLINATGSIATINGDAKVVVPISGALWLKINNDPVNTADSFGQYNVQVSRVVPVGKFSSLVLNLVIVKFKSLITSAGEAMFQKMTCMSCDNNDPGATCAPLPDSSSCTNFFTYIRAILTLYVMLFGMMFLLGMVKISNKDLVIRVVKIAIISGLLNGDTLRFFNMYIFDFVIGFADEMIANLSGYAVNTITTGQTNISNPFMFLDNLMSRIFFSTTFLTQVLALFSLGTIGIFYFILVFIALVVLIITVFRAISIYIMAFMAVALLLGLAPLFLTFLLFEKTYYLFENWARFLFRYMIEPVILMVGITVLTQLFTIYLDYVLGYSVCWKCSLVFTIPFAGIPGMSLFQGLPLFCINWFAPWGLDNGSATGVMGMNMQNMIALAMIAYAMYGYTELSGQLVGRLTSTMMAPSMTSAGTKMTSAFGQKALKQVGMDKETRGRREEKAREDAGARRGEVKKLLEEQKKWPASGNSTPGQGNNQGTSTGNNTGTTPFSGQSFNPNATQQFDPSTHPHPSSAQQSYTASNPRASIVEPGVANPGANQSSLPPSYESLFASNIGRKDNINSGKQKPPAGEPPKPRPPAGEPPKPRPPAGEPPKPRPPAGEPPKPRPPAGEPPKPRPPAGEPPKSIPRPDIKLAPKKKDE